MLVYLSKQPKWLLFLLSAAMLGAVLFAPPAFALTCLAVLLGGLAWLSYLSWPTIAAPARLLRVASLLLLITLGLTAALD